MKKLKIIFILLTFIFISNCEKSKDPITGKTKRIEQNVEKRAEAYRDKGGGIFNSNKSSGTTFEFNTSNVLWRASLKTLDFMPLSSASYSGGLIITDWYEDKNEAIKMEVRFLSNVLSANSIRVISYKKTCEKQNCLTRKLDDSFNKNIQDKIINMARTISIEDEKKANIK
jgi:hypothetical protein